MFYFAWVDKSETTFGPEHLRVDEEVFSLNITHAEGDFPAMSVSIINPRVGLLTGSRKQWVWLSYEDEEGNVTPLFFGRLLGVPQGIQDNLVGLMFVARPQDYEEQRAAVANALRVLPYFDPVWMGDDAFQDPDAVLEGYSRIWHIDRVTHEVTTSDILEDPEVPIEVFDDASGVYRDSVSISHGQSPARRVIVSAKAEWTQSAAGSIDITRQLLNAFKSVTPEGLATISGMARSTEGMINVICGDDLLEKWPNKGDRVGSGWTIGETHLDIVGGYPLPPTIAAAGNKILDSLQSWTWWDTAFGNAFRIMFDRTPGLSVQVLDYNDDTVGVRNPVNGGKYTRVGKFDLMWVPVFRMSAAMQMDYDIQRARTEVVSFELSADVQPLLTDPHDEETIYLDVGGANVDVPINGVVPINSLRANRYFDSDRGRLSIEHLMQRARAMLRYRARAVDVAFAMPFEQGLGLSCRQTAMLLDDRMPTGAARGKIKQYTLTVDGDTGASQATVIMGCAVGRSGTPDYNPGLPTYSDDYVNPGFEVHLGGDIVGPTGDYSYSDYGGYAISDDGVNLQGLDTASGLRNVTVIGGLTREIEAAESQDQFASGAEVMDKISGATTTLRIEMLPLAGGPFDSVLGIDTDLLHIPRMIDLETE
jgi:hypothetical protein